MKVNGIHNVAPHRVFSNTRKLVSKIVLLTAGGTAIFGPSPFKETYAQDKEQVEVQRTVEKEETKETKFERVRKEQEVKLKEIIALQEKDKEKVRAALRELERFYSNEYPFYYPTLDWSKNERMKLIEEAKPYLEKIFKENLELILSDNLINHNIARENIRELILLIPWNDAPSIQNILNTKKYLEPVFNEQFKDATGSPQETKIERGFYLLSIINGDKITNELNDCTEIFVNWLEKECSLLALNANKGNDAKVMAPILKKAITDLILGEYQYFPGDQHTKLDYRLKLFSKLIKSYAEISNLRKEEPTDLNSSIRIIQRGMELTAKSSKHPELTSALHDELVKLSHHTMSNIVTLEDSEEKTSLIYSLFVLPGFYFISENSHENQQELIVDPLNKYYFSRKETIGDTKALDLFIRAVSQVSNFEKSSSSYSLYVLFKTISDNPEYFEAGVNKQIEDSVKDKNTDSLNKSGEYFIFFNSLGRLNSKMNIESGLREKVTAWSQEKVCNPIFNLFIEKLNNERVTVKEIRQERYLNTSGWEGLNNFFSNVIRDPFYGKKLTEIIEEKLKEEKDPYQRRMYYEILSICIPIERKGNSEVNVTNFIYSGITTETSQHSIMGLAKLITDSITFESQNIEFKTYESVPYYYDYEVENTKVKQIYIDYKDFFESLEKLAKREITYKELTAVKDAKFTPTQLLILDLINISNGDMKRIEELTKRELTPKDGIILWRTMRNARSALAYSASLLDEINENSTHGAVAAPNPDGSQVKTPSYDLIYKRAIVNLLERRIGYYTDFENLGMEVSAYLELCSSCSENNDEMKQEMDKRLKNLKDYLFEDKYALLPIHERNREITKLRFKLAYKVLESAPPMQRRNQFDYLVALGFSEHELVGIKDLTKLYEK